MTMVSTWDVNLMQQYGAALGSEQRGKGMHVMLGPGINLARVPVCGRNFEYLGEDPHLAARMVFAEVHGIQSEGVVAVAKHFIGNNQEGPGHNGRLRSSSVIGDRALYELYYEPFAGAIAAGLGSVMCGYNLINGTYACQNPRTMTEDLKGKLNFKGWVMSDWGADHDKIKSMNAGMDQLMGGRFSASVIKDILAGKVPHARVDDAVVRLLTPLFYVGFFDRKDYGSPKADVATPAHAELARQFVEASTVLLKNAENILPLSDTKSQTIAIVGDAVNVKGGGSGSVWSSHIVSPTEGVIRRLSPSTAKSCASGTCKCVTGVDFRGNDIKRVDSVASAADCCTACLNQTQPKCNAWSWNAPPGNQQCWLKTTTTTRSQISYVISGTRPGWAPTPPPSQTCSPKLGRGGIVVCNYSVPFTSCGMGQCDQTRCTTQVSEQDISDSVALAKKSNVAIVNVAVSATEGYDRDNLSLGEMQNKLVSEVAAVNPNTIVVVRCPGAVLMPWANKVKAILVQFLPGQASGDALARLLFGDVNPSARLPISFPAAEDQTWLRSAAQYPGVTVGSRTIVNYTESLLIGYRWFDTMRQTPLFEFGAGLSYTTFHYSAISATNRAVSCIVKNTGHVAGHEVVQLYLSFPSAARAPFQVLKGFTRILLAPGEQQKVSFALAESDLQVWDVAGKRWQTVVGTFGVMIGSSSRHVRLSGSFENKGQLMDMFV